MTNHTHHDSNNKNPKAISPKKDDGKIKPFIDPDLSPDKNNPINPETDEPDNSSKKRKNDPSTNNISISDEPDKK